MQIVARAGARSEQHILALTGPVSIETVPDFLKKIRAETAPALILDFSGVPFIDSAGVGALVQSYLHFTKTKRRLALVGLNARVLAVLEITRVNKFFPTFATMEEAEAHLAG